MTISERAIANMRMPEGAPPAAWAERISASWRESFDAILLTGKLIAEAKAALEHGEFRAMCRDGLPFSERTAQRLMAIAADERLSNPTHVSHLPPNWGTLYEITRLDDKAFKERMDDGTINPEMDRKDIAATVKQQARATREFLLGQKQMRDPEGCHGVIFEDFEWDHESWSEKGRDRSPENHYPVSKDAHTAQEIVERTKNRFKTAADDCVLFMCATIPHLAIAIDVLRMRGFEYRSHQVWNKPHVITGYWFRGKHELILVGVKGSPPAPAMGTQDASVFDAPLGEHSEKPACIFEMIERLYPTLPKLELNSRRARPGWDVWGYEAPTSDEPFDPSTGEIQNEAAE